MLSRLSAFVLETLPWALAGVIATVLIASHAIPQSNRAPTRASAADQVFVASWMGESR
jgi:hypothetical protein